MQVVSVRGVALLLVLCLVERTWAFHPKLSRWTRQAIHCQPDDEACKKCSGSCNTVEESRLPECCEAYNTCCDQYFQACKKCESVAAIDQYFPEYCCASFTDCCHLITTFHTDVKPPEAVRKEPKIDLKIPTVAAPKPTIFPGSSSPAAPIPPAALPFPSHTQHDPQAPLTSLPAPSTSRFPPVRASPDQGTTRVVFGTQRTQSGSRSRQRSSQAARPRRPPQVHSSNHRSGRVTARGRVLQ